VCRTDNAQAIRRDIADDDDGAGFGEALQELAIGVALPSAWRKA
jgi:hypothetical protein